MGVKEDYERTRDRWAGHVFKKHRKIDRQKSISRKRYEENYERIFGPKKIIQWRNEDEV